MKNILLSLIVILSTITGVSAQSNGPKAIDVTGIRMEKTHGSVNISFTITANRHTVGSNDNLIVEPMLTDGTNSMSLPSILIQGNSADISEQRREADPSYRGLGAKYHIGNGEHADYDTTIPYSDWMEGAQLVFNGTTVRYNRSAKETTIGLIAGNVLHAEPQYQTTIVEVTLPKKVKHTMADRLSQEFSFLVPATKKNDIITDGYSYKTEPYYDYSATHYMGEEVRRLDEYELESLINDNREGALSVYFRTGERVIDRRFGDNNKSIVELVSAVRSISASRDSRIVRIVLAGFASPEGSLAVNRKLAADRALAVKKFLIDNTSIDPGLIAIYNGEEDWSGLRQLVEESDMREKYAVLDIIDNTPVWDSRRNVGRLGQLMLLNGGNTYRYMMRNFFPKLRNAAYIKIYYENF